MWCCLRRAIQFLAVDFLELTLMNTTIAITAAMATKRQADKAATTAVEEELSPKLTEQGSTLTKLCLH
jgi:hypothetical protein